MKAAYLLMLTMSCSRAEVQRDIEYGNAGGVSLLMDAAIPRGDGPFPAAILVHGGAWVSGDKRSGFHPILKPLADAGFATFSINYRLAPKFVYPAPIRDVEHAVRFLADNAAKFHIDPGRLVLIGESAGAELVEQAALDTETHVAAAVAFYAPSDLAVLEKSGTVPDALRKVAGQTPLVEMVLQSLRRLSPIEKVHKDMPPLLLIHGTADGIVPFESSEQMCDRIKSVGALCEIVSVAGGHHGMSTWEKDPEMQIYKRQMIEWLQRTLATPKGSEKPAE